MASSEAASGQQGTRRAVQAATVPYYKKFADFSERTDRLNVIMDEQAQTSTHTSAGAGSARQSPSMERPAWEGFEAQRFIDWVRENQTVAMLGAFAVGVFIGVMIRD